MSHWLWSDGKNYHLTRNSWYSLSRIVTSNNDKWFYHRKDNNQSIYSRLRGTKFCREVDWMTQFHFISFSGYLHKSSRTIPDLQKSDESLSVRVCDGLRMVATGLIVTCIAADQCNASPLTFGQSLSLQNVEVSWWQFYTRQTWHCCVLVPGLIMKSMRLFAGGKH